MYMALTLISIGCVFYNFTLLHTQLTRLSTALHIATSSNWITTNANI